MADVEGVYPAIFTAESAGDASAGITARGTIAFTDTLPPNIAQAPQYEALAISGHDRGLFIASLLRPTTLSNWTMVSQRFAQRAAMSSSTVAKAARGESVNLLNTAELCHARELDKWSLCLSLMDVEEATLNIVAVTEGYSRVVGKYLRELRMRKNNNETLQAMGIRTTLDFTRIRDLEAGTARNPNFPRLERVFAGAFNINVALHALRPQITTGT